MAYCAICGRDHDPSMPCAVANRPARRTKPLTPEDASKIAKRVDWILGLIAAALVLVAVYLVLS